MNASTGTFDATGAERLASVDLPRSHVLPGRP